MTDKSDQVSWFFRVIYFKSFHKRPTIGVTPEQPLAMSTLIFRAADPALAIELRRLEIDSFRVGFSDFGDRNREVTHSKTDIFVIWQFDVHKAGLGHTQTYSDFTSLKTIGST